MCVCVCHVCVCRVCICYVCHVCMLCVCHVCVMCVFDVCDQGARHAYAEMAGRNQANPTGILLCAANMLNHMNLQYYGKLIRDAVEKTIKAGKVL